MKLPFRKVRFTMFTNFEALFLVKIAYTKNKNKLKIAHIMIKSTHSSFRSENNIN